MKVRLTLLMAAVAIMSTTTARVHAAPIDMNPGGVTVGNIALGAPVTTNGPLWAGASPNILTDGAFVQTHALGFPADGFGYEIDLGSTQSFDSISVYPRQDGCCPERLVDVHLSVHADNAGVAGAEVWGADIFPVAPPSTAGSVGTFLETDGTGSFSGRFIKLISNQSPVIQYGMQMSEVEVIGTVVTPPTPVNHALNAPVDASGATYAADQSADKITDGNDQTVSHPASGQQAGFSYTVEMATPVFVDNINVKGRADGCVCSDRLLDYRIELFASDPSVGAPIPVFTQDATGLANVDSRVDNYGGIDEVGKWVRITNLSSVNFSPQIAEVEVFGQAVPEPSSIILVLAGLLGLVVCGRRRK